jgi:hypothetical protein
MLQPDSQHNSLLLLKTQLSLETALHSLETFYMSYFHRHDA